MTTRKAPFDAGTEPLPAGAPGVEVQAPPSGSAPEPRPPPPRRQYRRRLANHVNVRTALADVFRQLENDLVGDKKARAQIYALATLSGVIEAERRLGDLEERLATLEAAEPRRTP